MLHANQPQEQQWLSTACGKEPTVCRGRKETELAFSESQKTKTDDMNPDGNCAVNTAPTTQFCSFLASEWG
jgi:hypothetical protein